MTEAAANGDERFEAAGRRLLQVLRVRAEEEGIEGDDADLLTIVEGELRELRATPRRLVAVHALRLRLATEGD